MPLPENINPTKIINVIDPIKDVDGFHPINLGNLMSQEKNSFYPMYTSWVSLFNKTN